MQTRILASTTDWNRAWNDNWANPKLEQVRIAVAYCSANGASEIRSSYQNNNVPVKFLVGLNDGVTDIFARESLVSWADKVSNVEIRGTFKARGRFHPKLYIFETQEEWRILIGSVNLTKSAFKENTEAAVEWIFPRALNQKPEAVIVFEQWWDHATEKPLRKLGADSTENLNTESRLIALMKKGVLIDIEALLFPARGQFQEDLFELGHEVRVPEGILLIERLRKTQVFLIGKDTYKKLVDCRDKAHDNCRALSFSCRSGHFVPDTALSAWTKKHNAIAKDFAKLLECFQTVGGRAQEKRKLEQDLPTEIYRVWKSVHRITQIPEANFDKIIEQTLKQFDERAPYFHQTVRLNLSKAPHSFPAMLNYAHTASIVEVELHKFARDNREEILRDWMATLLITTRQMIVSVLDQLLDEQKTANTCTKLREDLCKKLNWFNFYDDAFCTLTVEILSSLSRTIAQLEQLRSQANRDLSAILNWPQLSFADTLQDFATRSGWDLKRK